MFTSENTATQILLVEDNPIDVLLLRRVFQEEVKWKTVLVVTEDGDEAIEYIQSAEHAKPDLAILDLNLPKRDGTEVLKVIRNLYERSSLPVIIFSSSPEDVIKSKVHQANIVAEGYFSKPLGLDGFAGLLRDFRICYETSRRSGNVAEP